jgi:hypothetical protein
MAEWFMPQYPPRPAEEAVHETRQPQVQREYDPNNFLVCSQCQLPIEQGEQCMEFFPGTSGRGQKSGRPMVVEDAEPEFDPAVLHIECIYDYVFEIDDYLSRSRRGEDDDAMYCAGCEAKLSGDDG